MGVWDQMVGELTSRLHRLGLTWQDEGSPCTSSSKTVAALICVWRDSEQLVLEGGSERGRQDCAGDSSGGELGSRLRE